MNQLDSDYRQGRRLIDEHLRSRARLSSYDLFRSCWSLIEENKEKFTGRAILAEYNESAWRVLVYHDFVKHFTKIRPDFIPPVRELPAPRGAAIVATIHTGLELGIVRALTEKGKHVSVIYAPSPQNRERSALFRPGGMVQYIKADSDCLLNACMALRQARVLLADCDHPLPDNPKVNTARGISNALFELAKRTGVELRFVLPYIDRRGHIDFVHSSMGIPPRGSGDCRLRFVEFLRSAGMSWLRWELP